MRSDTDLLILLEIWFMCAFQLSLLSMITPRYDVSIISLKGHFFNQSYIKFYYHYILPKKSLDNVYITIRGHTINEITETSYLGVIIDNKLSWKAHINYISNKISESVSLLKMLKYTFPSRILKSLYFWFIPRL